MTAQLRRDLGQLLWVGFHGTALPSPLARRIAAGEVGAAVLFRRNLIWHGAGPGAGPRAAAGPDAAASPPTAGGPPSVFDVAADASATAATAPPDRFDVEALCALTTALHGAAPAPTPLLVAVDQEGGRVQRLRAPAARWPAMHAFAAVPDDEAGPLARAVGAAMGRELHAVGIDVDFAPVLDVHSNPQNPIIGDRAFACAPAAALARAMAFADGLAAAGVLPCGKHFPGHGDTDTDSHLALPRLRHDLARLRAIELAPFAGAAAAGLPMLMTAHVVFEAIDPGTPATLSRKVITDLLRGELGYHGVVVSDDLDMKAIVDHVGVGDAAVAAIDAGCDALLLCDREANQAAAEEALVRAGERSARFAARVAEAAARVTAMKRVHAPRMNLAPDPATARVALGADAALAARLAAVDAAR